MVEELVLLEMHGRVAVLTMNRPHVLNALSKGLQTRLAERIAEMDASGDVGAIVLTGAGERAFCAGLDLRELAADQSAVAKAMDPGGNADPVDAVTRCGKPVIGALNGVAVTGGLELALACDVLIASENARFADTHSRVGIVPGWGLSQKLSRAVGIYRAKELSLTGNFIDARTAAAWRLVNRVVPAAELLPMAIRLATDMASVEPSYLRRYKALIDDGFALTFGEAMDLEQTVGRAANARLAPQDFAASRTEVQRRGRRQ